MYECYCIAVQCLLPFSHYMYRAPYLTLPQPTTTPPPDRNSDRAIYLCALTPRLYATLRNGNPAKGCTRLLKYTKPFFSFIPNAIFLYPERERKRERVASSSSSYRPEYKYTGRKKRSFFSHTCCSSLLAGVRYTHHRCRRSPGNEDVAAQDCAWASINNAVAVFPARGKFVARWQHCATVGRRRLDFVLLADF